MEERLITETSPEEESTPEQERFDKVLEALKPLVFLETGDPREEVKNFMGMYSTPAGMGLFLPKEGSPYSPSVLLADGSYVRRSHLKGGEERKEKEKFEAAQENLKRVEAFVERNSSDST